MQSKGALALAFGLALATATWAKDGAAPGWAVRATADEIRAAFPKAAWDRKITGSATLDCLATPTGQLSDCAVAEETPAGQGFGDAARAPLPHAAG